jgi:hypothetical protein
VNLESLTVSKLTELAETNNYDLKGATKKADIIAAILAARRLDHRDLLRVVLRSDGAGTSQRIADRNAFGRSRVAPG